METMGHLLKKENNMKPNFQVCFYLVFKNGKTLYIHKLFHMLISIA